MKIVNKLFKTSLFALCVSATAGLNMPCYAVFTTSNSSLFAPSYSSPLSVNQYMQGYSAGQAAAQYQAEQAATAAATAARTSKDGCDDEKNDRITPELALCSVHAYNIGENTNPSGADKQLMRDVVALKTTVITQQMNKQYEYMDAMIRRFKTQLEKAILTTKLQAAGAVPTSGSGTTSGGGSYGGASGNMAGGAANNGLATAEDCMNTYASTADVMQCLLRNVSKIQTAVAAGDLGTARRQLATDRATLNSFNRMSITAASGQQGAAPNVPCQNALAADQTCARAVRSGSRREDLTTCLGQMRACIIANSEALQNANRQQTRI